MKPVTETCRTTADVAVVGAGLAGTTCAMALERQGYRVALIDARSKHPAEFRAEKFGGTEMAVFERYGLGEAARSVVTPLDEVWVAQGRRLVEIDRTGEYGFAYSDLINALRTALPATIDQHVARVEAIERGPTLQTVVLSNGCTIEARLLVVATGLGDGVRRLLGMSSECAFRTHSLSLGFTLDAELESFPFRHFVYRPVNAKDRVSYLTLFATGTGMRANLFTYRDLSDPWVKSFRKDPTAGLNRLFPDLRAFCGEAAVSGTVDVRPMDLVRSTGPVQDGIVLIGDAYMTTCPTAGAGMNKALVDVARLCDVHAPAWLSQPGAVATASFYGDPVKQECDRYSIAASRELRAFLVEPGWRCSARRLRNRVVRTGLDLVSGTRLFGRSPDVAALRMVHARARP